MTLSLDANVFASAAHATSAVAGSVMHGASFGIGSAVHAASAVPASATVATDETFSCLGIKALGWCQYNPLKPNNAYLTLGDALAALGLVIAFLQLGTPTVRLRNRIRAQMIKLCRLATRSTRRQHINAFRTQVFGRKAWSATPIPHLRRGRRQALRR